MTEAVAAYVPRRPSRTITLPVRGLSYRIREWGDPDAPVLVMLHGARDSAATFQFLIDLFRRDYRIVAPDWRGHGGSGWTPGSYWLSDFLCDLDALMDRMLPDAVVPVIGHSMGGNIAALFAATRPERVSRLVLLDVMGDPLSRSPVRIADVLTQLLDDQRASPVPRRYTDVDAMAAHMVRAHPRLDMPRARFLTAEAMRPLPEGGLAWAYDPTLTRSLPTVHSVEEWGQCWRRIRAPVLSLLSTDPRPDAAVAEPDEVRQRAAHFADLAIRRVPETGHNVHHDAAGTLAPIIEAFLDGDLALDALLAPLPSATERTPGQ